MDGLHFNIVVSH